MSLSRVSRCGNDLVTDDWESPNCERPAGHEGECAPWTEVCDECATPISSRMAFNFGKCGKCAGFKS